MKKIVFIFLLCFYSISLSANPSQKQELNTVSTSLIATANIELQDTNLSVYVVWWGGQLKKLCTIAWKSFNEKILKLILSFPLADYISIGILLSLGILFFRLVTRMVLFFIRKIIVKYTHIVVKAANLEKLSYSLQILGLFSFWYFCFNVFDIGLIKAFPLVAALLRVVIHVFLIIFLLKLTDFLFYLYIGKRKFSGLDARLYPLVLKSIQLIVLIIMIVWGMKNFGINVPSLLAGLGLTGLVVALAARDTVANFFGSFMLLFDRPFRIGDYIQVGQIEGIVEEIGFRSTRIRTFHNSLVSMPNANLANVEIDNLGARRYRRIDMNLGITYNTQPEKIEQFVNSIRSLLKNNIYVAQEEDVFVFFTDYGDSSLVIKVYFFLVVPNWRMELTEKESILFSILRIAKQLNISFAFPSTSLYFENAATVHQDKIASVPKKKTNIE